MGVGLQQNVTCMHHQLTGCDTCSQLDVINRCIAVLLAGECGHVVDEVGVAAVGAAYTGVSRCREVVHEAGHPDEEQEKDEHHIEHEERVECHELHSLWRWDVSALVCRNAVVLKTPLCSRFLLHFINK